MNSKMHAFPAMVGLLALVTIILISTESISNKILSHAYSFSNLDRTSAMDILTTWSRGADMPTPRTDFAGASLNGKIYIIGGFDNSGKTSDKVEFYDPKTDIWSSASPIPIALDHAGAVSYNNSIYVVGGFTSSKTPASNPSVKLFIYSPVTDKWHEGKSLPKSRGALCANFVDGILYAIGGVDISGASNSVTAYDPVADEWTSRKPTPTAREHAASAVVDGTIYVVGGKIGNLEHNLNANEAYHPSNDSWTKLAPMLSNRSGIAAVASASGDIYVFGGEENGGNFNNNEKYTPASNQWQEKVPMPTARHGLVAETIKDKIYVIGGGPEPGLIVGGVNEIYPPLQD
jgi:N-acetylneuraminic acid mutarotase